ncbi:glutathione S-transferase N-terminal domain-containing protein [Ferrimonas aestuarii]|uniref:Glutathione S-transferase n=1 Tax=Ferrimonas aestuarii TaxID=2569539 RepID=A0A4U1BH66_9GAMM|nr:glutathione S-transferase N-terminal domain-containing protein [Ferrimonas aestuarii]TKB50704.1 glutathione S-transferase [Ferrimonas aestuarii]
MLLYYSDASPYARLVRVTARELEVDGLNEVCCSPFDDEIRQSNPLGKVPFLLLGSGQTLVDSQLICHYLDSEFGNHTLHLPLAQHWGRQNLNMVLQGLLDAAVALRVEHTRADEGTSSDFWQQRYLNGLEAGLVEVERSLSLLPEEWAILDIKLACLLEYLDFRHPDFGWRKRFDKLKAWHEANHDRASLIATRPQ